MLTKEQKHIITEYSLRTNQPSIKEGLKLIRLEDLDLSVRTMNCCKSAGLNNLYKIVSFFFNNGSFKEKKIRNAGSKTYEELDGFCENVLNEIQCYETKGNTETINNIISELSYHEQKMLLSLANLIVEPKDREQVEKWSKTTIFSKEKKQIFDDFFIEFCRNNDHLPMFWIFEQDFYSLTKKERDVLMLNSNIFHDKQTLSIEEIAIKFDLTRERVRQIREKAFRRFKQEVVELLTNKDDWSYILEFSQRSTVNQDSPEITEFFKKEKTNLSIEFSLHIVACVFRDSYVLLGGSDTSKCLSTWKRARGWNNMYLIRREIADVFDFESFKEEFENHIINNDIEYLLNINEYIANHKCWKKFDFERSDSVVSIVKDILLYEFRLYSEEIDGDIKIPASKEKNPLDAAYEILEAEGKPMHLNEIFAKFKKLWSKHRYTQEDNPERLRQHLHKHSKIAFRNRNSIYTLKEWEHIKIGTIRDAIIDYLSKEKLPQTANDITEHVLQHFPETNVKSIRATMLNDVQKRFSLYENSLFGLSNKQYPTEYKQVEQEGRQRKTFEQRLTDIEKFIIENDRFPFSSSEDKEEESLCRWWNRGLEGKQQLNETQYAEVKRVKEQYANYETDKNIYEWYLKYNETKIFLLKNRRTPSEIDAEKKLYAWLRLTRKHFQNDSLSEEQRKKYIELTKLI